MKVLWLSSANTLFNEKGDRAYNGKGWIGSLQKAVREFAPDITLGVAFLSRSLSEPVTMEGVTYFPIPSKAPKGWKKLYGNWTGAYREDYSDDIRRIVSLFRPDLMQIFGCESRLAPAAATAKDIPAVIHIQGILSEYIPAFFPRGTGKRDMVTPKTFVNEIVLNNGFRHLYNDYVRRSEKERECLGTARYLMGRTEWDREKASRYSGARYFHVDEVLRNAFYRTAGQFRTPSGSGRTIRITSTISAVPYKGLDLILKTAGLLKGMGYEVEWNVAGAGKDDNITDIFERKTGIRAESCGVRLRGVMDEEKLIRTMSCSEIYVHPSYAENSPNSVCEAQMLGMPVIATDCGGTPSLVHNGKDGVITPAGDAEALAGHIVRQHKDPALRESLGNEASRTAAQRHDREKIVSALTDVYRSMI